MSDDFQPKLCDACLIPIASPANCFYCGQVNDGFAMRQIETVDETVQLCRGCGGVRFHYACNDCFLTKF